MARRQKYQGVSLSEFAREVGVTRNAVVQRIKSGKLAAAVHSDGSLDVAHARTLWFANVNPNRMTVPTIGERAKAGASARHAKESEDKASEYDLKVKRMAVDLEAAEINLEKLKDSTVDKEEARRAARALMRTFRAAMLNFANRYAADIASEIDADPVHLAGLLEEKIRLALTELAKTRAPMDAGKFGESE